MEWRCAIVSSVGVGTVGKLSGMTSSARSGFRRGLEDYIGRAAVAGRARGLGQRIRDAGGKSQSRYQHELQLGLMLCVVHR
jgi:hypothetical protein